MAPKGQLMVSVAGIRGVVADTLTPEVITEYVTAFASERAGQPVVVGGDTRLSRPWIQRCVEGALMAAGCDVINIGIDPSVQNSRSIAVHNRWLAQQDARN